MENVVAKNKSNINANKQSGKKIDPVEGRCQFYLERKRRYCRTVPPKDFTYCVEHSHLLGDRVSRKRISCPLDPKHTCYEDQLTHHLKKCNARESLQPAYFSKNINLGTCEEEDKKLKVTVGSVSTSEVLQMVDRVKTLYAAHVPDIQEEVLNHQALAEEIQNPMNGDAAKKHLKQQASLVGHMDKLGLLRETVCYIEFGAGKGGLSHWVQRGAADCQNNKYLLVERGSIRYKLDSHHKGEDQGPNFERLRIDIQHLCLDKVTSLRDCKEYPIIGIGKHLCGGATDLMLRCLMQQCNAKNSTDTTIGTVEAIVLALCCHHRCDWQTFTGKQFFTDLGLSARDFHLISSMTSWATCGTRVFLNKLAQRDEVGDNAQKKKLDVNSRTDDSGSLAKRVKLDSEADAGTGDLLHQEIDDPNAKKELSTDGEVLESCSEKTSRAKETDKKRTDNSEQVMTVSSEDRDHSVDSDDYFHPRYGSLTAEEREEVGYKCKKLIDMGRLRYVQDHGFDVRLVKYTTSELSLENVALLATLKKEK